MAHLNELLDIYTALPYTLNVRFVETTLFTRQICALLSDDEYMNLQEYLITDPRIGRVISGSGGMRKLRWGAGGKGRRGGARVIYYWKGSDEAFYMLAAYPKSKKVDLTKAEIKIIRRELEA